MNDVFLGAIAAGVLVMAIIQVAALIYTARIARRVDRLTTQIEPDIGPLVADLRAMTADAARVVSVAAAQVDHAERLLTDVGGRVEQAFAVLQSSVLAPLRDGAALLAGLRAQFAVVRDMASGRGRAKPVDEDDGLFIG